MTDGGAWRRDRGWYIYRKDYKDCIFLCPYARETHILRDGAWQYEELEAPPDATLDELKALAIVQWRMG